MRKIDRVYREILHRFYSSGERFFNQKNLSEICRISLGTINPLITKLEGIGAIERKPQGFRLIDPQRALISWAVTRDLARDITYTTFVPTSLKELESSLPRGAILTAYSGFRARFGSTPAEYNQVFVYADEEEMRRAFRSTMRERRNLIVLQPDEHLRRLSSNGVAPPVQLYVDLWQLGKPASRFVEELERKLSPAPERALGEIARSLRSPR
ncbi:MAG: hypothetical protein APZ16_01350 [Candidatus Hadarchaeum yellowstonense]|jgi:DNA-binding transcriptional MocR family regulator|uniref:Uncharacterized protein n=1 Tax=Hadarchaeum yellowstonense TaxID=1776334 RepID=A0A147JTQ3_HADYE|nr:MAG: hypothetical protein APZ16_01350 [Candidatus Hadarchaeum yellowstonense]